MKRPPKSLPLSVYTLSLSCLEKNSPLLVIRKISCLVPTCGELSGQTKNPVHSWSPGPVDYRSESRTRAGQSVDLGKGKGWTIPKAGVDCDKLGRGVSIAHLPKTIGNVSFATPFHREHHTITKRPAEDEGFFNVHEHLAPYSDDVASPNSRRPSHSHTHRSTHVALTGESSANALASTTLNRTHQSMTSKVERDRVLKGTNERLYLHQASVAGGPRYVLDENLLYPGPGAYSATCDRRGGKHEPGQAATKAKFTEGARYTLEAPSPHARYLSPRHEREILNTQSPGPAAYDVLHLSQRLYDASAGPSPTRSPRPQGFKMDFFQDEKAPRPSPKFSMAGRPMAAATKFDEIIKAALEGPPGPGAIPSLTQVTSNMASPPRAVIGTGQRSKIENPSASPGAVYDQDFYTIARSVSPKRVPPLKGAPPSWASCMGGGGERFPPPAGLLWAS